MLEWGVRRVVWWPYRETVAVVTRSNFKERALPSFSIINNESGGRRTRNRKANELSEQAHVTTRVQYLPCNHLEASRRTWLRITSTSLLGIPMETLWWIPKFPFFFCLPSRTVPLPEGLRRFRICYLRVDTVFTVPGISSS